MCVGDLKLGRRIRTVQRLVAVTTTSSVLVAANQQRVGLRIAPPDTARITASLASVAIFGQGFTIQPGDKPCYFSLYSDGDLPSREFTVISDFGTSNLTIWESFLTEEELRESSHHS